MKFISGTYLAFANILLMCTGTLLIPLRLISKPRYWKAQHNIAHGLLVLGNILRITRYHPALNYMSELDEVFNQEASFPHSGRVTFEATADYLGVSTQALEYAVSAGNTPELDEHGCFDARDIRIYAAELGLEVNYG